MGGFHIHKKGTLSYRQNILEILSLLRGDIGYNTSSKLNILFDVVL